MNMYIYDFEPFDYVCIHQNYCSINMQNASTYHNIEKCFPRAVIDYIIELIVDGISKNKSSNEILVLDFRRMDRSGMHPLRSFMTLLSEVQYKVIYYLYDNDNEDLGKVIQDDYKTYAKTNANLNYKECNDDNNGIPAADDDAIKNKSIYACIYIKRNQKVLNTFTSMLKDKTINELIDERINKYFFQKLKENGGEKEPLISSNVYVENYFNVKKAFIDSEMFNLLVYKLAILVEESLRYFEIPAFDAFLCGSITGACLASAVSVYFKRPVSFLKNIGPNMTVSDEKILNRIHKGHKYVYIYDFICMGTEFDRIKLMCNIKKGKIVCSTGISFYRLPHLEKSGLQKKNEPKDESIVTDSDNAEEKDNTPYHFNSKVKIGALFQINQFEKDYYKCYFDK